MPWGGSMQNKHKGFTLIELMVTIAVMAIIAMMAAPSFIDIMRKNQLNSDTRDFIRLLVETRSEAIFKQQSRKITFNGSGGFKNWINTEYVERDTAATTTDADIGIGGDSLEFTRLGQAKVDKSQCFVMQHMRDNSLKAYVLVQKVGTVLYSKTASSCNYEKAKIEESSGSGS